MILRDRDADGVGGEGGGGWTGASDGTLEERRYFCQNWRADVSVVITDTGKPVEWVKYSAYGTPFNINTGDYNADLVVDAFDYDDYTTDYNLGSYKVRLDMDLDGDVDSTDQTLFNADQSGLASTGRGVLSRSDTRNMLGYAGYMHDRYIPALCHVRHRVLMTELGRWTRRDPLGYVDGVSAYEYVVSNPLILLDSLGLRSEPCDCPEEPRMLPAWWDLNDRIGSLSKPAIPLGSNHAWMYRLVAGYTQRPSSLQLRASSQLYPKIYTSSFWKRPLLPAFASASIILDIQCTRDTDAEESYPYVAGFSGTPFQSIPTAPPSGTLAVAISFSYFALSDSNYPDFGKILHVQTTIDGGWGSNVSFTAAVNVGSPHGGGATVGMTIQGAKAQDSSSYYFKWACICPCR